LAATKNLSVLTRNLAAIKNLSVLTRKNLAAIRNHIVHTNTSALNVHAATKKTITTAKKNSGKTAMFGQ
ncbi:hypothetical protein ACX8WC_05470, partial [Bacillus atrophaeus]